MLSRKPPIPEDLQGIDAALRQSRPALPEDRTRFIAARARSRARASVGHHTLQKETFLRSRIAITVMLVLGFGFSSAGVGMAVTGVATDDTSAADVQYDRKDGTTSPTLATPTPTPAPVATDTPAPGVTEVEGDTDEGSAPVPGIAGDNDSGDNVAPASDEIAAEQVTQETRQLGAEQGDDELPFTGFAAIPVLLMGLSLLSAGFVLRRRA